MKSNRAILGRSPLAVCSHNALQTHSLLSGQCPTDAPPALRPSPSPMADNGGMSDAKVSQILKDCLDDLKLTIDSMEPVEADLLLLLAILRFRLEPRLEGSGTTLRWEVQELPTLVWLDPSSALNILRIIQESIANILRHTRTTEIRVSTALEAKGVRVNIADNGQGFDIEEALRKTSGRGLQNQLRRAQAVEGTVH